MICGNFQLYKCVLCAICSDSCSILTFFGLEHEQTDRMCILTLCSLESLMLSEISFTGKWWHTIKVIAICYVAHLGQLEETYYVLPVFWGHSDTVPQGLAISLTMNSSNSH